MDRGHLRNTLIAILGPLATCVVLVPFRARLANTNAALILVLVIVAVAALGSRMAGALAALSAASWFDFFLTRPYEQFTIFARADIETTLLLLVVGVAVTEIAHWGRRQQADAGRQTGYLAGLQLAAGAVAGGQTSTAQLIEQARQQLVAVLGATACRFDYGTGLDHPVLEPDGRLVWGENLWDVDQMGLPVQTETEIRAMCAGRFMGRFLITALPDTHPSLDQRTVAAALAGLIGVALGAHLSPPRRDDGSTRASLKPLAP